MSKQSNTSSKGQYQIPCTEIAPKTGLKRAVQSLVFSAVTMTDALWKPGDKGTITVTFGGYACDGCSPDAAWSQIGNHSSENSPSMNLGFIDPPYTSFMLDGVSYTAPANATRNYCGKSGPGSCTTGWVPGATVIHEFGHALGMLHEHQNNLSGSNPIELNKPQVVAYYNCIGMGESGAATNVLDTYSCSPGQTCNYAGTKFDPDSIMLYYLPSAWIQGCTPHQNLSDCNTILSSQTCGKNPTKPNFKLSQEDIGWLKQQYPLNSNDPPIITVKFVDPNPEPWKVAWVQKTVTETYGSILGIKWIFDTASILRKSTNGTTIPLNSLAPISSSQPATSTIDVNKVDANGNVQGTSLTPTNFLIAVLVPTLFVALLLFLLIYSSWLRKRQ